MPTINADNIPLELKLCPQWVMWRYENRNTTKPTKVPYSSHNGTKAAVDSPASWATFDHCLEMLSCGHFDGIGFVLTPHDPYAFIDLDARDAEGNFISPEDHERQKAVVGAFDSYTEFSPSGEGLHILVRGAIPQGRKRQHIEVYSEGRYFTVTGNTFKASPINDHNELLNVLWSEMAPERKNNFDAAAHNFHTEQLQDDASIYDAAAGATNGQKFIDLWQGHWQDYYTSQSEADFAIINILAFYTQSVQQIRRLFHGSALGKREKAHREDYLQWMLDRCFDRMLPPIDLTAIQEQAKVAVEKLRAEQAEPKKEYQPQETSNDVPLPPGLLGDIARFVYQSSPRPVAKYALAAAIGLMSGICGRAYNVSGTGLNQYTLVLGMTGTGKEAIAGGPGRLIDAVAKIGAEYGNVPAARSFIGPSEIASPQALQKFLVSKSKSFVAMPGEIGMLLRQMADPRAPTNLIGLRRAFLILYSKSGQGDMLGSLIYSNSEKTTEAITAPAFSILGEATPKEFFEGLDEAMLTEGFLPRFTIIEYKGLRPPLNKGHSHIKPSKELVTTVASLATQCLKLNNEDETVSVDFSDEAQAYFDAFNEYIDGVINEQMARADNFVDTHTQFWNRAHLKSMKLASLVAVGMNPYQPVIDEATAAWAVAFVKDDVRNMLVNFEAGNIGGNNNESQQVDIMLTAMKEYVAKSWDEVKRWGGSDMTHQAAAVPWSYLTNRLMRTKVFRQDKLGATRAMDRAAKIICDNGSASLIEPSDMREMVRNGWIPRTRAKFYKLEL